MLSCSPAWKILTFSPLPQCSSCSFPGIRTDAFVLLLLSSLIRAGIVSYMRVLDMSPSSGGVDVESCLP